jgi:hypothetical protein
LNGFYKTPEEAKEVELLQNLKKAIKILRGNEVELGVRVGEHSEFTTEGWKVIGGLVSLVAEGYLTKEALQNLVAKKKAETEKAKK